jgi:ubiquinone/menaquinone biosynthesis C-methylase UbiE
MSSHPAAAAATQSPVTAERIMQMAWGYAPPLMIGAAVRHGLFDALAAQPRTAEELAEQTRTSPRGMRMIANALVALGLLAKQDGRYALTPESDTFLVSTKPSFQGGLFKHIDTQLIPKWLRLNDIVRTGRPPAVVNQEDTGSEFFQKFVEDIFPMSYAAARALGQSLKLAAATAPVRVLDLAAGSGVWGIALAQQSPQVRVTAVDWPGVIPVTRRVATKHGVVDRFTFVEGDINSADLGTGHTIATLGHILHSEGETRSRALLKRTFDALAPGGTIAIAEFLTNDDHTGPANAAIFAVNMLVNTDEGDTFSAAEISGWLREAGFENPRTLDAPGPSPLVLANKPA